MTQGLNSVFLKYEKFTSLQGDKLVFIYNTLKLFKKEFKNKKYEDKKYFLEYLENIYLDVLTIQDILVTCCEDLELYLYKNDLGCLEYLSFKNVQNNIRYLSDKLCVKCMNILQKCISDIIY